MNSEDKVLNEIRNKISELFIKIGDLKVTEDERREFNAQKADYQILIDDYKKHKAALVKRERLLKLKEDALDAREKNIALIEEGYIKV